MDGDVTREDRTEGRGRSDVIGVVTRIAGWGCRDAELERRVKAGEG